MKLSEGKINQEYRISKMNDEFIALKLTELGAIEGEKIKIKITAPFNDPIAIEVFGTLVSLRKSEAEQIEIIHCI